MAWWQNFSGGGSLQFPLVLDLIPGIMSAEISLLDFSSTAGTAHSLWSYVSKGLVGLGQRELIFLLRKDDNQDAADFPQAPCEFFKTAATYALRGEFVEQGSVSEFGPGGFMAPRFRAFGYVRPHKLGQWTPPEDAMAIVMLTEEELGCARVAGLTRVLGLMGLADLHFPCPIWNDLSRPSALTLEMLTVMEQSFLNDIPRLSVRGGSVWSDDEAVNCLLPTSAESLLHNINELDKELPLALLCGVDAKANALLVWPKDSSAPMAIRAPGTDGKRLSGSFLCSVPGQDEDRVLIKDDGYALSLMDSTWMSLRNAIAGKERFELAPENGLRFTLDWYQDEIISPQAEILEKAYAMGSSSSCSSKTELSDIPARTMKVQLLTHEPDVAERMQADQLLSYIEHLTDIVAEHFVIAGRQEGFDLFLKGTLTADGEPEFEATSRPVIEPDEAEQLVDRLSLTFAPRVMKDSVSFSIEFAIWGGFSEVSKDAD